jgi:hypothetical protein
VESLRDRMVVSLRLALANWKSGDSTSAKINVDEALKIVDNFPAQEHSADFYRQSVAEARMEVGDVEGADRTLGRIKDDSQRSKAFRTVGLIQARRGDFKGAILKAPAIQNPKNRDQFLQSISESLLSVPSIWSQPCSSGLGRARNLQRNLQQFPQTDEVHGTIGLKNTVGVSVADKFSVGDRVFISLDFFWAKGATGTISIPPPEVTAISGPWDGGLTRQEKSTLGEATVY